LGDGIFFRGQSEVSNRVLFGGWEIFFFYHHVRRRVRGGSYVCLSVIFFFVCPRNYLNNVQNIIKVHFCQLRLVVSFNNILYTHARIAQASHHDTLGRGAMGTYGVHDPSATVLSQAPKCIFFCFLSNKREERDYLLSLFVLLYVELESRSAPHTPHTRT